MKQKNLSYAEAIEAMMSNFKVRHSSWNDKYLDKNSVVSVAESMSNDWVIDPDPYDPVFEEMKDWVFNDLEFSKDRQSRHYPNHTIRSYFDLWLIIENHLRYNHLVVESNEYYKRLIEFIKENELLK
jgi:hypothetical protein